MVMAEHGGAGVALSEQTVFSEYYRELYEVSETTRANKELQNPLCQHQ